MEPSGRNRWQPVANRSPMKKAQTGQSAAGGNPRQPFRSAWQGGGRRFESVRGLCKRPAFESVRGLCKSPAKRGFWFAISLDFFLHAQVWNRFWNNQTFKAAISSPNLATHAQ